MRIKIKGATSQNIATTIQWIIDQFQIDMYEVNIYINFSKNGVPLIFVDEKEYQEVWLSSKLDPQKEYPITKFNFEKFITKAEQKNIY